MTIQKWCNALAMMLVLAATPGLVMANADSGKAKGAAKAAAPRKATKLSGGDDPIGAKGAAASSAKGAQVSSGKGAKPLSKLGGGDDPIGVKGAATK